MKLPEAGSSSLLAASHHLPPMQVLAFPVSQTGDEICQPLPNLQSTDGSDSASHSCHDGLYELAAVGSSAPSNGYLFRLHLCPSSPCCPVKTSPTRGAASTVRLLRPFGRVPVCRFRTSSPFGNPEQHTTLSFPKLSPDDLDPLSHCNMYPST